MGKYLFWKPILDFIFSVVLIILLFPFLIITFILSSFDTGASGIFVQKRIGQFGQPFMIYKFRTIHPISHQKSAVGNFLRSSKIDELPQLFNVLKGEMSLVGPRPDVPGYYDKLEGQSRRLLNIKPGITSVASIKYRNEQKLLENIDHPDEYNDQVIFPDKVYLNLKYYDDLSLSEDLRVILLTLSSFFKREIK